MQARIRVLLPTLGVDSKLMSRRNDTTKNGNTRTTRDLVLGLIIPAVTITISLIGLALQVATKASTPAPQSRPVLEISDNVPVNAP